MAAVRAGFSLVLLGAVSACELAEVDIAPGEDILIVESVLRAGDLRQAVVLHHSLRDRVVAGESGARVTLSRTGGEEVLLVEGPPDACVGRRVTPDEDSVVVNATCYRLAAPGGIQVEPEGTYELRITTLDGRHLRARTTVPGAFRLVSPATDRLNRCALRPGVNLPVVWSVARGAWSYISLMEIMGLREALAGTGVEAPERLELTGVAVSARDTVLVVPADFGLFELDGSHEILELLQHGFPSGVTARVTIVAADRNYVNAVRGGGFNPSGTVRISSVIGDGLGLFGSAVQREMLIVVGDDLPFPPCTSL